MKKQRYDLEERLLEYSVRIIKIVEQLPNTRAGKLIRALEGQMSIFHENVPHILYGRCLNLQPDEMM